jgi:hypothetical protein
MWNTGSESASHMAATWVPTVLQTQFPRDSLGGIPASFAYMRDLGSCAIDRLPAVAPDSIVRERLGVSRLPSLRSALRGLDAPSALPLLWAFTGATRAMALGFSLPAGGAETSLCKRRTVSQPFIVDPRSKGQHVLADRMGLLFHYGAL